MIKLLGALLVLTACGLGGVSIAAGYARRPQLLRSLQTALQFLETEINYGSTPLPEALAKVARAVEPELASFFQDTQQRLLPPQGSSLEEAWRRGLEDLEGYSPLTLQDTSLLISLGSILGGSDRRDQVKHLQLTRYQLRQAEEQARERAGRNERMWRYLGFLVGLMLVLTFY